jgi:8-oxo-dGTP pyrophosphatase MutT (NUDIX family)
MYHNKPPSIYSYQRLIDLKEDILDLDTSSCLNSVLYGIPKGRLNPKEDTIIAAIREFKEETGIKIVSNINPEPFVYKTPGVAGGTYQLKCWIYELEDEIELNDFEIRDTNEICHRLWVTVPKVGDSYVEGEFHRGDVGDGKTADTIKDHIYIDNESTSLINMYYQSISSDNAK